VFSVGYRRHEDRETLHEGSEGAAGGRDEPPMLGVSQGVINAILEEDKQRWLSSSHQFCIRKKENDREFHSQN
jgi:hypothetical protein